MVKNTKTLYFRDFYHVIKKFLSDIELVSHIYLIKKAFLMNAFCYFCICQ